MIRIRPEGLSPDSTYFVGLKATDISGVEINESKTPFYIKYLSRTIMQRRAKTFTIQ